MSTLNTHLKSNIRNLHIIIKSILLLNEFVLSESSHLRIFTLPLLALVLAVLAAVASESLSNVTPIKKGDEQSRHKNIIWPIYNQRKEYKNSNLIRYSYLFLLPHIGMLISEAEVKSVFKTWPQNLFVVIAELQVSEAPSNIVYNPLDNFSKIRK